MVFSLRERGRRREDDGPASVRGGCGDGGRDGHGDGGHDGQGEGLGDGISASLVRAAARPASAVHTLKRVTKCMVDL